MGDKQIQSEITAQISAVREFNRFYTARLGLLRRRHLDGEFSLTEARILYEIGSSPKMTASTLCKTLELDPGYISRILSVLAKRKLVRRAASAADGREKLLTLSVIGEKAVSSLNEQSIAQIQGMLVKLQLADREALATSLAKVRSILSDQRQASLQIVRLKTVNNDALEILREYYEAVHVFERDKPQTIQKIIDAPASGVWLAYLGEDVVGCVVLRKLTSIPSASECKRLYVRPHARGNNIAAKLLDAQETFARSKGIEWTYLDSYDDLKTAIALYEKRGYQRCERYNKNPQATLFMRKYIGL